jgi:cyclic pyranopterin phosphate synthase
MALGPLEIANNGQLDGEAQLFRLPGSAGDVGFISSVTALSRLMHRSPDPDGRLRLCLHARVVIYLPLLRKALHWKICGIILDGIWNKPRGMDWRMA